MSLVYVEKFFLLEKLYRKPLAGTSTEEISIELHFVSAYNEVVVQKL